MIVSGWPCKVIAAEPGLPGLPGPGGCASQRVAGEDIARHWITVSGWPLSEIAADPGAPGLPYWDSPNAV